MAWSSVRPDVDRARQDLRTVRATRNGHGRLGLPTGNEYRVPNGQRTDFENGALISNGLVTTILKTDNVAQAADGPAGPALPAPAFPQCPSRPTPVAVGWHLI